MKTVILAITSGMIAALAALLISELIIRFFPVDAMTYARYLSPFWEEILKSLLVIYLIASRRAAFLVDSLILGFAVGTGFALLENIYYLISLNDVNLLIWVIRGFGTAIMHGGTTCLLALVSIILVIHKKSISPLLFLPGLFLAMILHSFFNGFILPPVWETLFQIVALPLIITLTYQQGNRDLANWLQQGMDSNLEILRIIRSGSFSGTEIGQYLLRLKQKFPAEIVVDMFCFLRIFTELAIAAKGSLLLQEFEFMGVKKFEEKIIELEALKKSMGKSAYRLLMPLLNFSSQEIWQIGYLRNRQKER
ncbi:MAG: PrsW family intramembrane metalloprotease [Candidatus Cloacimonetes bacterium]|nr:PrsW family intramembrane metalloprotease [Candidatus Cloacimonadota bacterium]